MTFFCQNKGDQTPFYKHANTDRTETQDHFYHRTRCLPPKDAQFLTNEPESDVSGQSPEKISRANTF